MKRKIEAKTFTPKYDPTEDRIRLSINYSDVYERVDLMITRAFVLKLFPTLEEYTLQYYKCEPTYIPHANSNQARSTQKENTTPTDKSNLELYKQEDELLMEIQFVYNAQNKTTQLRLSSAKSEVFALLSEESLKQIFHIIKQTIPSFAWGVSHAI